MTARRAWLLGLLLTAAGRSVWALASPRPEYVRAELDSLLPLYRLVGKGRLTVWGLQVYDAKLWALPGFKPDDLPAQPFALEVAYLRDFKSKDIAERSITEMRRSAPIIDAQAKTWSAELQRLIPDIKKGDRVMGVHLPGSGPGIAAVGCLWLRAWRAQPRCAERPGHCLLRFALRFKTRGQRLSLLFHHSTFFQTGPNHP